MTDSTAALRHQIASATDLQSVVRTMRALAASGIHQYEESVGALVQYRAAIESGLGACMRDIQAAGDHEKSGTLARKGTTGVIVFGSDQGLVGSFNEVVADRVIEALRETSGPRIVRVVGERAQVRLEDAGIAVTELHPVPGAVEGIAPLVDRLLLGAETLASGNAATRIEVFHNRPVAGAMFEPARQQLLPLDAAWRARLMRQRWPADHLPQVIDAGGRTLSALIREYLFVSLFQACAESLASENASRLAAMQRADRNIDELLTRLRAQSHAQRQSSIDEELFDLTTGYAALSGVDRSPRVASS